MTRGYMDIKAQLKLQTTRDLALAITMYNRIGSQIGEEKSDTRTKKDTRYGR